MGYGDRSVTGPASGVPETRADVDEPAAPVVAERSTGLREDAGVTTVDVP